MKKAESDISGCLNDSLQNLGNIFIFKSEQMIASNGLLESIQWHDIGNKSLARIQIDFSAVNLEARSIMKAQMRNRRDETENLFALAREQIVLVNGHMSIGMHEHASDDVVQLT